MIGKNIERKAKRVRPSVDLPRQSGRLTGDPASKQTSLPSFKLADESHDNTASDELQWCGFWNHFGCGENSSTE